MGQFLVSIHTKYKNQVCSHSNTSVLCKIEGSKFKLGALKAKIGSYIKNGHFQALKRNSAGSKTEIKSRESVPSALIFIQSQEILILLHKSDW